MRNVKIWEVVVLILIISFLGFMLYGGYAMEKDCRSKGGFMVRGSWGYQCIKGEVVR